MRTAGIGLDGHLRLGLVEDGERALRSACSPGEDGQEQTGSAMRDPCRNPERQTAWRRPPTVPGALALQHRGLIAGFSAHLLHVQAADVTVAVLHNSKTPSPVQDPSNVARRLAAAALGDPYPQATPVAVDVATLRQYAGVYRVDEGSTLDLRVVDGKLTAQRTYHALGEVTPREALTAIADDMFLYPDGLSRLQMERDATGKVTGMRFWFLGEGEGAVAPLTDQALPIDFSRPREALGRLFDKYWAPVLAIGAMLAVHHRDDAVAKAQAAFNEGALKQGACE